MTYEQTREQFLLAWNSNAYLNMCESDDMKNAIEALEKQIPKKPTEVHEKVDKYSSFYSLSFMCPSCETAVIFQSYKPKYCKHCGQKIQWGD